MSDCMDAALRYVYGLGISCLPLLGGRKTPAIESWKQFQERLPHGAEIIGWPAGNIGIITGAISRLVVVDCESVDDAKWFWMQRGKAEAIAFTPRGVHLYFKHPGQHVGNAQRVKDDTGKPRYDIRGDGGYVVAPPSQVEKQDGVAMTGSYTWKDGKQLRCVESLTPFNPAWRPVAQTVAHSMKKVTDGVAYIRHIRAVSGQGGHADTWRAVNRLKDSGMSEAEALAAMIEWNATNAEPPWVMGELLHKVKDCYSRET